jgi:hypothetical protein
MTRDIECATCGTVWTHEVKRGRQPKICADCREDPVQLKKRKLQTDEEKREAAQIRVSNLETNLKASGNHLSQKRERRSYSISELEERIHRLEEFVFAGQRR